MQLTRHLSVHAHARRHEHVQAHRPGLYQGPVLRSLQCTVNLGLRQRHVATWPDTHPSGSQAYVSNRVLPVLQAVRTATRVVARLQDHHTKVRQGTRQPGPPIA